MTAVEWLEEELKANLKKVILEGDSELMESLFEQAKEMEKDEKIEFAKMHVKTALKAVENEMILHASSVKHWYLPQNIK